MLLVRLFATICPDNRFEHNINLMAEQYSEYFDGVVLEVIHKEFINIELVKHRNVKSIIYDVKGVLGSNSEGNL